MKKVVLITSGQPALNPRLVKEADILSAHGFRVIVIYQYWNNWGTELDNDLLKNKKWQAIRVGGSPIKKKVTYNINKLVQKLCTKLFAINTFGKYFAEFAVARTCYGLYNTARSLKADLYIAHNLGALAPAVWAAEKNRSKVGFDAEDFHRFETSNDENTRDVKLKKYLEEKYIPKVDYLTAASPLIAYNYQLLFPAIKPHTILNVFPNCDKVKINENQVLKVFWFSQTIGSGRGIEEVIHAIGKLNSENIELHLLGDLRPANKIYFNKIEEAEKLTNKIKIHNPINPDDIVEFASQFDVGIASEASSPFNRDICLTNKIFTYFQAGLAVVATDTQAQRQLLSTYRDCGFIYKAQSGQLADILKKYATDKTLLANHKKRSLELGIGEFNWKKEGEKFLAIVTNLI